MKILFLTTSSTWGGTEVHTLALAKTLAQRGHAVELLSLGHDAFRQAALAEDTPITWSHLEPPGPLRKLSFFTWKRLLRPWQADLAIFPKGHVNCGSLALDLAARRQFGAYLTIEHLEGPPLGARVSRRHVCGLVPGLGLWWYRQWLRYHARGRGPHRVVCVSEAVRARLVEQYRWPASKVQVVRNGIDSERFRPDAQARADTRRQWGISPEALVCGMVGRLAPEKGCDLALECFTKLLVHDHTYLVFVGDGPMAPELQRLTDQKGLEGRVIFAGRTNRPWEVYPAIDVLLMPSRVEGLPLGLLEAMACGCCPVAMAAGGIAEVVTGPDLGWLVREGDAETFVASVQAALEAGAERRQQIGAQARACVQAHFNASAQFAALAAIIERGVPLIPQVRRLRGLTPPAQSALSGGRQPPESPPLHEGVDACI